MATVFRAAAIVLLVLLGLPTLAASYALGQSAESNLPACCRREGAHHCAMTMAQRSALTEQGTHIRSPEERCPFCPSTVPAGAHLQPFAAPKAQAFSLQRLRAQLARSPQTETHFRIARERARHKRGPPLRFL